MTSASTAADTPADEPTSEPEPQVAALIEAKETGHRVEIDALNTATETTWANPDGTLTTDLSEEPTRVQDEKGDLVPIDTDLVKTNGHLEPKAAAADVALSADGGGDLATLATSPTESIAIAFDEDLRAPTVNEDTATYRIPSSPTGPAASELRVSATTGGFTARLKLNERPAEPQTYDFDLTLDGLNPSLEGNSLLLKNDAGHLVAHSRPFAMWDSQVDHAGDRANVVPVGAELVQAAQNVVLRLTPSYAFLNDPATQYPVTVDPDISRVDGYSRDTYYFSNQASNDSRGLDYALRLGSDNGSRAFRSYEEFDTSDFNGKHVTSATLHLFQYHAGTCSDREMNVRPTATIAPYNATWGTAPTHNNAPEFRSAKSFNRSTSCDRGFEGIDVTPAVAAWTSGRLPRTALGLLASDEHDESFEKRFCSYDPDPSHFVCNSADRRPYLSLTYNSVPTVPAQIAVAPGATGYTTSVTPTISARLADPDANSTLELVVMVLEGSDMVWSGTSTGVASGTVATMGVPEDVLDVGQSYTLQLAASDGIDVSAATSQSLAVDAAGAVTPAAACSGACVPIAPQTLYDTVGGTKVQPGETVQFSAALASVADDVSVDRLHSTVTARSGTQAGSVSLFDPDLARPVQPTLAYSSNGVGSQVDAVVMTSNDDVLAIRNNGTSPVDVTLVVDGWFPWIDADEAALDEAEESSEADPMLETEEVIDLDGEPDLDEPTGPQAAELSMFASLEAPPTSVTEESCTYSAEDELTTCIAPETEASEAEDAAEDVEVGYEDFLEPTPPPNAAFAVAAADSCPTSSVAKFSLSSRYNACRNRKWTARLYKLNPRRLIGTAKFIQQERYDLDQLNLSLQHKWRYVLTGLSTSLLNLKLKSNSVCLSLCSGGSLNSDFDDLDRQDKVGAWNDRTWTASSPAYVNRPRVALTTTISTSLNGSAPNGFLDPGPSIRCDNLSYIAGSGCIFPNRIGKFQMWVGGGKAPRTAQHIYEAQKSAPHWGSQERGGHTLSRLYGEITKSRNRRAAKRLCRLRGYTQSCDEYPFASTHQGCALISRGCHVAGIPLADNSRGGAMLGSFYGKARMADGDKFYVRIRDPQ